MGGVLCSGFVLCAALSGCNGSPPPVTAPAGTASAPAKAEVTEKARQEQQSEDLLSSILAMLKLESLGITAQEDDIVGLMNQWQRFSQGNQVLEEEVALDEAALEAWRARLSERQLKQVRRSAFNRSDVERLRNDLLMKAVVKQAAQRGKNDLERVSYVFANLVRNTELVANHPDDVPLSPYQIYLLGKATAADRAWLFAEMLRQLKIDTVILSAPLPKDAEAWDVNQPFLVGVLLDKQVYLFDPKLGLPLMVPGSTGSVTAIATLEQVRSNGDILKQYAISDDKPYPLTAELLKSPGVYVIGDTARWCYRFGRLQRAFTGARAMVIFDPLIGVEGQTGQVSRVTNWPGKPWEPGQIAVWDYPENQLSGQESLSAQHQQTLTRITDAWKTPVVGEKVKQNNQEFSVARGTNLYLFARLDHAQGKLEDAVMGYTRVRVQLKQRPELKEVTERLVYAYMMADEDTLFWTGVCKVDQGTKTDRRIATDKLQQYLKVYAKGRWVDASHGLLAELAADAGDFAAAIAEIEKITPDHPQHQGFQFLKRKWEKAAAAAPAK